MIQTTHIILYVKDQEKSCDFYRKLLDTEPSLNVPGMTEFQLGHKVVLGLMPEKGIKKLLDTIPDPESASGIPRAELYLRVDDPEICHIRAIELGAKELSSLKKRDWGDITAYSLDPDGHMLAFAKEDT